MKLIKFCIVIALFAVGLAGVTVWQIVRFFNGPFSGAPLVSHADLPVEFVDFTSASGTPLKGSLLTGEPERGTILLMHGYTVHRNILARRARFLYREGYSVFMFDFQAHGQSGGEAATLGYRESYDARAAMQWMRKRFPDEKIAIVATSMGAVSVLIGGEPVEADAYVLESPYYALPLLVERRVREVFGPLAAMLTPAVLWWQQATLGFDPWAVIPAQAVGSLKNPVLFVGADRDQYVMLSELQEMYGRITAPKELWIIEGQPHGDFSHTVPEDYERKVLDFLARRLRGEFGER